MNSEQILTEIREANLTYLMLAQNLIRSDRTEALFRLGMSEDAANLIAQLSPAQILALAANSLVLCRFRMDDATILRLLTKHKSPGNDAASRLHTNIVLAGKFAEAI